MKPTIIAILPAYNAKKTFKAVVDSLPAHVFDAVILSDDCSRDGTFEAAKKDGRLTVVQTPRNLGYGGNLKYSLSIALEMGADSIVEIHPDGEYLPDGILASLKKIKNGAHLVLGNRFKGRGEGMFGWKQIGTKMLTHFDNAVLKTACGDLHQGFRVYTRELLDQVPYKTYANDYLFSFEIIVDAVRAGLQISEIPVGTIYTGSKRGALPKAAIQYSLKTFGTLFKLASNYQAITQKLDKNIRCDICATHHTVYPYVVRKFTSLYKCYACGSGFTYPLKWDASGSYPEAYYANDSVVSRVKSAVYGWFQRRRIAWVKSLLKPGSRILDVGAGEGLFGRSLGNSFSVVNTEAPFARVSNSTASTVITEAGKKIGTFDAVAFWESLEHIDAPRLELRRISRMLKPGGFVFIEYPRFDSWESRVFSNQWYHLDLPRHRTHFSRLGLNTLVTQEGFDVLSHKPIFAEEYVIPGGAASMLGWTPDVLLLNVIRPFSFILYLVVLIVSCLVEVVLAILGQSPIGLVVAVKRR